MSLNYAYYSDNMKKNSSGSEQYRKQYGVAYFGYDTITVTLRYKYIVKLCLSYYRDNKEKDNRYASEQYRKQYGVAHHEVWSINSGLELPTGAISSPKVPVNLEFWILQFLEHDNIIASIYC